jgi:hypothetical protein
LPGGGRQRPPIRRRVVLVDGFVAEHGLASEDRLPMLAQPRDPGLVAFEDLPCSLAGSQSRTIQKGSLSMNSRLRSAIRYSSSRRSVGHVVSARTVASIFTDSDDLTP